MNPNLRIALPVIAILALAGIGAAVVLSRPEPATNTNAVPANTNLGADVAVDPVGTPVNASLALGAGSLEVVKAFRVPTYRITQAGPGYEFIVVQFRPLAAGTPDLYDAAASVTLSTGGGAYAPRIIELPTVTTSPDGLGALAFPVPAGSKDPVLVLPGGATVNLPV